MSTETYKYDITVNPARAGMIRPWITEVCGRERKPRASGDGPQRH